ncbi:hypothetical protein pb186bvf_014026 [Paramecium bursaria]
MKNLDHPNVVKFLDFYETANNIYIVSEYCDGGDLRDIIKQPRTTQQNIEILRQLLEGYKELYLKQIIHRDIKPANILIHKGQVKLADFGFAKKINFEEDLMTSIAGTPLYMAPQVILRQPYTSKCDIWSIGMIFYELLFSKPPLKVQNLLDLVEQVQKPIQIPQLDTEGLNELLSGCLQFLEENRYNFEQITNHPLFVEDFYMKQIENFSNPQEIEQDYKSLLIQNYLNREFQKNYEIFMNQLEFVKCLYNFCLFIMSQKSTNKNKTFNTLLAFTHQRLALLENPMFIKEEQKYWISDQGLQCKLSLQQLKNAFLSKFKDLEIQIDQEDILSVLPKAIDAIQQSPISHQKLCFILMAKQIIHAIEIYRIQGPTALVQIMDIQLVEALSDQEILFRI